MDEGFARLAKFLAAEKAAGRALPQDAEERFERWEAAHPGEELPLDP